MSRYFVVVCTAGFAFFASAAKINVPTVEISKGIHLPMITMGGENATYSSWGFSNYSLWLELGGRGFDTAWEYQTSGAIAKAFRESGLPRSEIFITHKIPGSLAFNCTAAKCHTFPEIPPVTGHYTKAMARHFLADNMKRLGPEIGYVDLLLLHTPCGEGSKDHNASECAAIYEVLEEAVQNGTARAIGVSNHDVSDLEELLPRAKVKPVVNQCHMSVGNFDQATYNFCKQHGITYQAWSPLHTFSNHDCIHSDQVTHIATAHNVDNYAVAQRWIVQHGVPFVTATNKSSHMTSDSTVFDFKLADEEMQTLDAMQCGFGSVSETLFI